jgi:hypothetical protein
MDETWFYHYNPETKQQSMEWRYSGKNPLEMFSPRLSGIKTRWHPPHDYLPKGQTINAEYYSSLLVQLNDILKKKRRTREGHQGGLTLTRQCPSSPGTCNPEKLVYLGFQYLDHPPYSPDLAPSGYHLFSGLKKNN